MPKDKILPLIPRGDFSPVGELNREVHEGVQDVIADLHRGQGLTVNCSSQLSQASWERVVSDQWVLSTITQNDHCQGPTIGARIEGRGASSFTKRKVPFNAQQTTDFYSAYFIIPKKDGSSSHSRSQAPQPVLKNSSIQDDSYKDGNAVHTCRRMVHIPGFKRRIFPYSNLSRAQAFSPLCFLR